MSNATLTARLDAASNTIGLSNVMFDSPDLRNARTSARMLRACLRSGVGRADMHARMLYRVECAAATFHHEES